MIKAENGKSGVAVSITGNDMMNVMDEFVGIVSALLRLTAEEMPPEIAMMGIHTAVLTGMTKALDHLNDDDDGEDMMDILKEALKKEHEE